MYLVNLSRFSTACLPAWSLTGEPLQVVCVAARYQLPRGPGEVLRAAEQQPDPIVEDRHWGAPGVSSLWMEGQGGLPRPGADIYVSGHAWAPQGRPVAVLLVSVRLGEIHQQALVFGDRRWRRGITGMVASEPDPFVSMPLCYERAFGGAADPRNPVGCGFYSPLGAVDQPLPNIESRHQPISDVHDRPEPVGFAPIARHWLSRAVFAGTYDEAWTEHRAPFWPEDVDTRFFHAAPPALQLPTRIRGGEWLELEGLSVEGRIALQLPTTRILLKNYHRGGETRRLLDADALHIEPDAGAITLYHRATVLRGRGRDEWFASVVRELHDWEDVGYD